MVSGLKSGLLALPKRYPHFGFRPKRRETCLVVYPDLISCCDNTKFEVISRV